MRERKALVIIDMQNDFIDENVLGNKETAAVVQKIVEKVNAEEFDKIYLTQDTHFENYLETQEGRKLPVKHCIYGTDGWNIVDEVQKAVASYVIPRGEFLKETFGSIELGKGFNNLTRYRRIDEIVLVGVCTDICVISNAILLKAFCPEIPIVVDASCCAGTSPENHKRALEAMKMCQIEVINEE